MDIVEIFVIAIVVTFVVYILCNNCFGNNIVEGMNESHGSACWDCETRNFASCSDCFNCGFCVNKDGTQKCMPGDQYGPFKGNCDMWYHNDPFSRMIYYNSHPLPKNRKGKFFCYK